MKSHEALSFSPEFAPIPEAQPSCGACGGTLGLSRPSPAYRACGSCGTLRSEVPEGDYQAGYYFHDEAHDARGRARARLQLKHVARMLQRVGAPPHNELRTLELGCAKGFFVEAAVERGIDAWGVDFSAPAITAATQRGLGQRCLLGAADQPAPEELPQGFDLVCAWEVIEHLDEPEGLLHNAFAHLRPGGWLIGSTPNSDSTWAKRLGRGWHGYAIPQFHRLIFTGRGLERLARRTGFGRSAVIDTTEPGGTLLLKNRATTIARDRFGSDSRLLRASLAAGLALPEWALEQTTARLPGFGGDTLLFAAQKPMA